MADSRPLIVVGDKTDHGGEVIQGSPVSDAAGKPIARVGDKVTCPKKGHGGTTVIASGDPTFMIDGQPAARHGDKTACGATLLSSQALSTD
ncbi:PAAR domain-containing protein [Ideonella sp. DXS29W]|uniref:PAAR domain-containing protein n=1 Tax=Ideonella lacteola TaxID=2984193 RepID=A0ABU9BWT3_9BURK